MGKRRQRRVGELIHREISELLEREMSDPRLNSVTITGVEVSPDLRHARVYVSTIGEEIERQEALAGLKHAAGFIRHELGARLRLRYVPELSFHLDKSLERGQRIEELLAKIHRERDA